MKTKEAIKILEGYRSWAANDTELTRTEMPAPKVVNEALGVLLKKVKKGT